MYTTVHKFQYKNKSFGTDYYVPKYMLIIVYLNKSYIFHYYKLSRLYSTKHHLTPLYHTIHPYTSPYVHVQHHAPLYLTIYLYTSPYTPIHHHTSMYNTIHPWQHPCIIPCTPIHHHIPLLITIHLYTSPCFFT